MRILDIIERIPHAYVHRGDNVEIDDVTERAQSARDGSIFVCISGDADLGERYLPQARARGARAFVCEHAIPVNPGETLIITENARKTSAEIAGLLYGDLIRNMTLVGITGTKGKSTVAKMLYDSLKYVGINALLTSTVGIYPEQLSTRGIINTTPPAPELYSILAAAAERGITHAVIEVSSQALVQYRTYGLHFSLAIFTGISSDHIGKGEHSSMEEYLAAKRRLFADPVPNVAIADLGGGSAMAVTEGVPKVIYIAKIPQADYHLCVTAHADSSVDFSLNGTPFSLGIGGVFNASNAALALAAASELTGAPIAAFRLPLLRFRIPGRLEHYRLGSKRIIIDFAHNRESFRAVLTSADLPRARRICVFGSVGGRSQSRRAELAAVAEELCALSVITADDPGDEPVEDICAMIAANYRDPSACRIITDRKEAILAALSWAKSGDTVFLLGKGHEQHQLIGKARLPFSERQIIMSLGAVPLS